MLVMVRSAKVRWTTFQPSQLPLGTWVACRDVNLTDLAESFMRSNIGTCLVFSVTQIDPLQAPAHVSTARSRIDAYINTAWLELSGTFDGYWAARGKNLRQNMRKQRNKLAADDVTVQMRVITRAEDIAPALTRYGALESTGWKADQGTAIHPDNAQGRFYCHLFEDSARRGEAVLYEYMFGDKTVAMNLCLLRANTLIVLKTAYDESNKTLSPAFLLREAELQSFFSDGSVTRIEYFGRVMDWHTKFTDMQRTLYHFTYFRWAWLKRLGNRRSESTSTDVGAIG